MPSGLILAGTLLGLSLTSLQGLLTPPLEFPSRGEVVMSLVLTRTQDVPVIWNTGQFADVPKGHVFETYLFYAEKMGIVRADVNTNLKPDTSVTRAEFLKMLALTYGLPLYYTYSFADVTNDSWYAPYAGLAQHYGLFELSSRTQLEPMRVITRQDIARAISLLKKKDTPSAITLEQTTAQEQAAGKLKIYTVISTRTLKVVLTDAPKTPLKIAPLKQEPTLQDIRSEILKLVNAIRAEKRIPMLSSSFQLEQSAQEYAERMVKDGFFGHTDPNGKTLKDRIVTTGFYDRSYSPDCNCVKGFTLGENLARGQKTAREAVDAWMKSPSHRAAIINPDYTYLGVGAKSGVWVQHFGGVLKTSN